MPKIVILRECALKPDVHEDEFEQHALAMVKMPGFPGWSWSLLKRDRGAHRGKYILLIEIESIEVRDRYIADNGGFTEEGARIYASLPESARAFEHFISLLSDTNTNTDYVVSE